MRDVWKLEPLVPRVSAEFLVQEVWQRAENLLNDEQLIDLGISREKWLTVHELAHYAADGPDVDFFAVRKIFRDKQQLRRSVLPGSDIVRQFRALTSWVFLYAV